jgi:hypothetical protein
MDFIMGLTITNEQHGAIMVVVDKLTEVSHFVHTKTTHKTTNIFDIYMKEVAHLHGVPKIIVSDRDPNLNQISIRGYSKGSEQI